MTPAPDAHEPDAARKLSGAMLEHSGFAIERLPGLAVALDSFMAEAPKTLTELFGAAPARGAVEPPQATTLFQAIGDCAGLTASIFASSEPSGRLMIILDERIDDLVVASAFGKAAGGADEAAGAGDEAKAARTAIEAALIEAFATALGKALETAFAPFGALSLGFEKLVNLSDAFALGKRDLPAVAARFSLPMTGGACEGLVLAPQTLLLPFRKALERVPEEDAPTPDSRWSHRMEAEVKQTRLPVTAVLEDLPMSLGEIAGLEIGAVLPLQTAHFGAVRLECAGRGMFLCKLGQGEGRYRLELETPIADSPELMIEASGQNSRAFSAIERDPA